MKIKISLFVILLVLITNFLSSPSYANKDIETENPEVQTAQTEQTNPTEPTESKEEVVIKKQTLTLTFTGDLALGTNFGAYNRFEKLYKENGAEYFLSNVQEIIGKDDATIACLESVFTNKKDFLPDKLYTYKAKPKYVSILKKGSVEYVSVVNNHMQDYLQEGFDQSIKTLNKSGIKWFGYSNAEPSTNEIGGIEVNKIEYIEKDGIKVALLSYYGFNVQSVSSKKIKSDVKKAKRNGAQFIIASIHAGDVNTSVVKDKQILLSHELIDKGVDLVIGNHPHVIQKKEKYKGKQIYYSLGNFLFVDYAGSTNDKGLIVQLKLTRNPSNGKLKKQYKDYLISWTGGSVINNHTPTIVKSKADLLKINKDLGLTDNKFKFRNKVETKK